jgi:hypothetical protein
MPELQENWDPNEWEDFAYGLLSDRHGAINVMKVPARHKGDFGVDYYCLMDCVVYQCYAVQEPCEVADRADKQKSKLTYDLNKFCSRKDIANLFSDKKIKRWILLVPIHDSAQVNLHLSAKTAEVRDKTLPYIHDDFEVMIHDLSCFDLISRELRAAQRRVITVPFVQPTETDIELWTQASDPLVSALSAKLTKRFGKIDETKLNEEIQKFVGYFLEKENALDSLRRFAPQLHEALLGVASRHLRGLTFHGPSVSGGAQQILRSELDGLKTEIKEAVPNFSEASAFQIALGTVVEWLLRCPLDFPPYSHGI